jgi:hypothetical protein
MGWIQGELQNYVNPKKIGFINLLAQPILSNIYLVQIRQNTDFASYFLIRSRLFIEITTQV